jgi:hypothetical protein
MVDAWNNLGSNGNTTYTKPGKYQLIYLLPVLVHLQIGLAIIIKTGCLIQPVFIM